MIAKLARLVLLCSLACGALALTAPSDAADTGPALSVSQATLDASLSCHGDLAAREPVLLVPGTLLNPTTDFSWNYERAFTAQGRPWCVVTLPGNGMGDIQIAAEYVVNAIRTMHDRAGGRIQILGHSQGGMVPRWALKYWPDTRAMVDDLVGLAPSNHGTIDAYAICAVPVLGCSPAIWQQETTSRFLQALNTGPETWAGISYTDVYTQLDEVVVPNLTEAGSSSLHTGDGTIRNVAVQQVCPLHLADHITIGTSDPVAYALAIDALDHAGPADPARVSRSVCTQLVQPGVDPLTFAVSLAQLTTTVATTLAVAPRTPAEPRLAAYAAP